MSGRVIHVTDHSPAEIELRPEVRLRSRNLHFERFSFVIFFFTVMVAKPRLVKGMASFDGQECVISRAVRDKHVGWQIVIVGQGFEPGEVAKSLEVMKAFMQRLHVVWGHRQDRQPTKYCLVDFLFKNIRVSREFFSDAGTGPLFWFLNIQFLCPWVE